jgi:hypothetical protein
MNQEVRKTGKDLEVVVFLFPAFLRS